MLTLAAYRHYCIALALTMLAHYDWLPISLTLPVIILLGWRYMVSAGTIEMPSAWLKHLLTLLVPLLIWVTWGQFLSLEALSSIVLLGVTLKFLEISSVRDSTVVALVIYFFSSTVFLFTQTIVTFVLVLAAFGFTTLALYCIENPSKGVAPNGGWYVTKLILQTLPIVAVLFLVTPRFAPLWSIPLSSQTAQTGMGGTLKPGDISNLIRSSEIVFRAEFASPPQRQDLYWRALVMDTVDNGEWRPSQVFEGARFIRRGEVVSPVVSVLVEPTQDRWLYTLEGLQPGGGRFGKTSSGIYSFLRPPVRATQIKFDQLTQQPRSLSELDIRRLTSIDNDENPRLRAWINDQQAKGYGQQALIDRLLHRFRDRFYYSLQPPLLTQDSLDQFMFDTLTGFCEHFAALTATAARMANIPSRIVTGYLGGRPSGDGSHWVVRQYDAHAWVELWYKDEGWVRIDPTAYVAPERISLGLEGLTAGQEWVASRSAAPWAAGWLTQWEDLNYQWAAWMSGFSQSQQRSLLTQLLGEITPLRMIMMVLVVLLIPMIPIVVYWARKQARPFRFTQYLIERQARRFGIERKPAQSLHALCYQLAKTDTRREQHWINKGNQLQDLLYKP